MNLRNAEANFENWKRLVGLSENFPNLSPLDSADFDKVFLKSYRHLKAFDSLSYRIMNPRIAVMIARGQGCTTIYKNTIFEIERDSLMRRHIPIEVPLNDIFWNSQINTLDLEYTIRLGIFSSLIYQPWDQVLFRKDFNELVNAWGYESTDGISEYLMSLRIVVENSIRKNQPIDWKEIADHFKAPDFSLPLETILANIGKYGLKPILFFDTSWDRRSSSEKRRSQKIKAIAAQLKSLYNSNLISSNKISHVIFTDQDTFDQICNDAALTFEYDTVEFPRYSSNEIFGMLNKRYSWEMDLSKLPKLGRIRIEGLPLTAILDEEFLTKVYDEQKGINQIINDMKNAILATLDIPWSNVPYRLHIP